MERGVKTTLDHRQGKSPLKKPPQAPPKEGMSLSPLIYIWLFQTVCNKDIPSFGGAWGGFLLGGFLFIPRGHLRLIQGINRSVIRQSIILIVKLMSFKTSVLIWFSRFRGTAPPQANGVGLLYKTEVHGFRDIMTKEHII